MPAWTSRSRGPHRPLPASRQEAIAAVKERNPWPETSLAEGFDEYFDHVLHMSQYFNQLIDMRVGFDISGPGGGRWAVDFRPGNLEVSRDFGEPHYVYRFDSRWLPPILDGSVPWEDFFLSLRLSAWRHPDIYNDHLLGLLKFAWPDALEAVEKHETTAATDDRIVIRSDEVDYVVERFCPYAGQDLSETGELLPGGILRCLGHHYEFSLETGECLNGKIRPLRTERAPTEHRFHA